MCMRAFIAVAVVMQGIQRENLEDKRYSEGINKKRKQSIFSLFYFL